MRIAIQQTSIKYLDIDDDVLLNDFIKELQSYYEKNKTAAWSIEDCRNLLVKIIKENHSSIQWVDCEKIEQFDVLSIEECQENKALTFYQDEYILQFCDVIRQILKQSEQLKTRKDVKEMFKNISLGDIVWSKVDVMKPLVIVKKDESFNDINFDSDYFLTLLDYTTGEPEIVSESKFLSEYVISGKRLWD